MTDQEQTMLDCAKLANQDQWQWYNGCSWWRLGIVNSQSEYDNILMPIIAKDGHPDTACSEENRSHIAASSPANVIASIESKRALEGLLQEALDFTKDVNAMPAWREIVEEALKENQ